MKLKDLIAIANEAYPDDRIQMVYEKKNAGDSLAKFIVKELKETFDPKATSKQQLTKAIEVMRTAQEEIKSVEKWLIDKRESLPHGLRFND
jgi:uncharacterized membrane protein YheB (UPF0754 family)